MKNKNHQPPRKPLGVFFAFFSLFLIGFLGSPTFSQEKLPWLVGGEDIVAKVYTEKQLRHFLEQAKKADLSEGQIKNFKITIHGKDVPLQDYLAWLEARRKEKEEAEQTGPKSALTIKDLLPFEEDWEKKKSREGRRSLNKDIFFR